jgi:sterol desaturase/sphingolipid hydroxylase (fatty acid hydroxylase superfamily)
LALPLCPIDWLTASYYVAFVFGHFIIWNAFHCAMHRRGPPWYVRIPPISWWFKYVEYYHFLHHQHRDKNFNAWLPLWDWLLGTLAQETQLDRRVWQLMEDGESVDRRGRPLVKTSGAHPDRQLARRES